MKVELKKARKVNVQVISLLQSDNDNKGIHKDNKIQERNFPTGAVRNLHRKFSLLFFSSNTSSIINSFQPREK